MAWQYIPAQNVGTEVEQPEMWVDDSNPAYPLVSKTDPSKGFANKYAALESLYLPMAGGNMAQMQSLIASNPSEYSKYGITPENAASMVDSTFYDRLHNIDNDPLANIMNPLIEGGIMAALGAGVGNLAGLTSFGDGSWLNSMFGNPAVTVAEGGMPTQVGGWSWEDPTFSGSFNPSLPYNAVSANDPIGALIQNLESGMTPSQAVSAVEAAIPGTTRSALEQFLYEAGTGASSLGGKIASGLGSIFGGQEGLASKGGSDLLSMLGKIAPSLLGMYASNQQSEKLSELAQKYQDFGAPYRSKLAEISANPDAFYNSTAAQQGVNAVLNKLSIGGNPSGSPYKQQLAVDSLWNDYGRERDRLAGFGGLTNYNAAAPNLEAQAVGSNANMYNALGAGLNDIFNPKTSLADLLKQGKLA